MSQDQVLTEAIETVARDLIAKALFRVIDSGKVGWEDYADLGEHDFVAVSKRVEEFAMALGPQAAVFEAAYDFLSDRAEGSS